jgi:hypothetical protein
MSSASARVCESLLTLSSCEGSGASARAWQAPASEPVGIAGCFIHKDGKRAQPMRWVSNVGITDNAGNSLPSFSQRLLGFAGTHTHGSRIKARALAASVHRR